MQSKIYIYNVAVVLTISVMYSTLDVFVTSNKFIVSSKPPQIWNNYDKL